MALLARAAEKVLVNNHDLYCLKLDLENDQTPAGNLQIKETLETLTGLELRDWRFPYIDYALYDILPNDPKEAATIKRKAHKFYYNAITRTIYTDCMIESSFTACHIKRLKKYSKRLIMVYVELTNLV